MWEQYTVNVSVCALRTFATWLHDQGHLSHNPAARLKTVAKQDPPAPSALAPRAVDALLREVERTGSAARNLALVQVLLQTGMRIGECAALTWPDLTIGERSGGVTIRAGKGNKARWVPLNRSVRQALADYAAPLLAVEPTLKVVAAAWPRTGIAPLWRSRTGGPLGASAIRQMLDGVVQVCAARGSVPPTTSAHTLRHTFAKMYLHDHPGDLVGLAMLLGHSSVETTRIYGPLEAEELAERVERVRLNAYG